MDTQALFEATRKLAMLAAAGTLGFLREPLRA